MDEIIRLILVNEILYEIGKNHIFLKNQINTLFL